MKKPSSNAVVRLVPIEIKLAETGKAPQKIQVIRTGTFHHPKYGQFKITKDHLQKFKENFDKKVRGVDIALDYGHHSEGEAAAWFRAIELSSDGTELWAEPEWTPDGEQSVVGKKYRYVSADFNFDYVCNETLEKFGPTLLGAGLTNRPVVKGQAPVIELAEGKGEPEMDPKDQKIAELETKIAELTAKLEAKGDVAASDKEKDELKKQLDEANKTIAAAEAAKQLSEKKVQFDMQLSDGKVVEAQREAFMKNDMVEFMKNAHPVKLSQQGHGKPGATGEKSVQDEVMELAETKSKESKIDIGSAISLVLSENPTLRQKYESATA